MTNFASHSKQSQGDMSSHPRWKHWAPYLLWSIHSPQYPHKSSSPVSSPKRGPNVSWVSVSEFPSSYPVTLMSESSSHLAKQYTIVERLDKRWPVNSLWTCSCVGQQSPLSDPRHDTQNQSPDQITLRRHAHVSGCMWLHAHAHIHRNSNA